MRRRHVLAVAAAGAAATALTDAVAASDRAKIEEERARKTAEESRQALEQLGENVAFFYRKKRTPAHAEEPIRLVMGEAMRNLVGVPIGSALLPEERALSVADTKDSGAALKKKKRAEDGANLLSDAVDKLFPAGEAELQRATATDDPQFLRLRADVEFYKEYVGDSGAAYVRLSRNGVQALSALVDSMSTREKIDRELPEMKRLAEETKESVAQSWSNYVESTHKVKEQSIDFGKAIGKASVYVARVCESLYRISCQVPCGHLGGFTGWGCSGRCVRVLCRFSGPRPTPNPSCEKRENTSVPRPWRLRRRARRCRRVAGLRDLSHWIEIPSFEPRRPRRPFSNSFGSYLSQSLSFYLARAASYGGGSRVESRRSCRLEPLEKT